MKSIVCPEFPDMVEAEYGYAIVDRIIEASAVASNGVYTAVGTYTHGEVYHFKLIFHD